MNIRKALSPSKAAVAASTKADNEAKTAEDEAEDDDEKVLNEMEEMTYAMDRKKKRAKKVLSKRRAKVRKLCSCSISLTLSVFLPFCFVHI